jgi:hypothetical protein
MNAATGRSARTEPRGLLRPNDVHAASEPDPRIMVTWPSPGLTGVTGLSESAARAIVAARTE